MGRMNWVSLWDKLMEELGKKNSWGKNEVLDLMKRLEMQEVRRIESES